MAALRGRNDITQNPRAGDRLRYLRSDRARPSDPPQAPPLCREPCAAGWFVKVGETVDEACRREVREETNIELRELTLVGVYSDVNRDPRGHIVSVAYATQLTNVALPRAGSDTTNAEWLETREVTLGFDHARILADAKAKIFTHPIGTARCPS